MVRGVHVEHHLLHESEVLRHAGIPDLRAAEVRGEARVVAQHLLDVGIAQYGPISRSGRPVEHSLLLDPHHRALLAEPVESLVGNALRVGARVEDYLHIRS